MALKCYTYDAKTKSIYLDNLSDFYQTCPKLVIETDTRKNIRFCLTYFYLHVCVDTNGIHFLHGVINAVIRVQAHSLTVLRFLV